VNGFQTDRSIIRPGVTVLNLSGSQPSATSLSIAGAVPKNAKTISGTLWTYNTVNTSTGYTYSVMGSDSNMNGSTEISITSWAINQGNCCGFANIMLVSPQTIYYTNSASSGSASTSIIIGGYTF
jgi:hypothetical protein